MQFSDKYNNIKHNTPTTQEQLYYRTIFEKFYNNQSDVLPYFWMPRFIEAKDSSARTLQVYNENMKIKEYSENNKKENDIIEKLVDEKNQIQQEKKNFDFSKSQINDYYDRQINILNHRIENINNTLMQDCNHEWQRQGEGSYDEPPDRICTNCDCII